MKVTAVKPLSDCRVEVEFDNGKRGIIDLSDYAGVGVSEAWSNPGFFEQISITDNGALAWPGELDLCPDVLYMRLTRKSPEELFLAAQA